MRERACCGPDADPRHLAVSAGRRAPGRRDDHARQGDAEPLRAALAAAVDYVRSFATRPRRARADRRHAEPSLDPRTLDFLGLSAHNNGLVGPFS